jgi:hypothetical protein
VPLALWSATPTIQICSVSLAALTDDQRAECLVAQLWGCSPAATRQPAASSETSAACDAAPCGGAMCGASECEARGSDAPNCNTSACDPSRRAFCVGDPTGGSGLLPQAGTDSVGPSLLAAEPVLSAPTEVGIPRPSHVSSPRPELVPWRSAGPIRGPPVS